MAAPAPGGGGNAGKDMANAAKLALLGLGTLATGAFGMIGLAAGYKYKKKHATDPSKVTPATYFDDLTHLRFTDSTGGEGAGASGPSSVPFSGSPQSFPTYHSHRDREYESKTPNSAGISDVNGGSRGKGTQLSAAAQLEAEAKHAAEVAYWDSLNDEEEDELTFRFRPANFAHMQTASPSFPLSPALLSHVASFLPFESMCVLCSVSRPLRDFSSALLSDRGFVFRLARSRVGFSEQFRGRIWMRITGAGALANSMGRRASSSAQDNFYEHLVKLAQAYKHQMAKEQASHNRSPLPPGEAASSSAASAASSSSAVVSSVDLSEISEEARSSLDTILKDVPRTLVPSNAASHSLICNLGNPGNEPEALSPGTTLSALSPASRQQHLDALFLQSSRQRLLESLSNLLSAYSLHDTELGYCQGMNMVAAHLLSKLPEHDSYWLFYLLMQDRAWNLRDFYLGDLKGLLLCKYQFEFLFALYLPALSAHFRAQDIHSDIFTEWFMTFFTFASFPRRYDTLDRTWDLMLCTRGLKYVFRIALSILYLSQSTLLTYEFEDLIFYLKHLPDDGILNPQLLLPVACDYFKVSNRALREIEKRYEEDIREGQGSKRRIKQAKEERRIKAEQQRAAAAAAAATQSKSPEGS